LIFKSFSFGDTNLKKSFGIGVVFLFSGLASLVYSYTRYIYWKPPLMSDIDYFFSHNLDPNLSFLQRYPEFMPYFILGAAFSLIGIFTLFLSKKKRRK
jgi:glucan phosphoethanolaminetransferase (alkaline phosphatase superfamily)